MPSLKLLSQICEFNQAGRSRPTHVASSVWSPETFNLQTLLMQTEQCSTSPLEKLLQIFVVIMCCSTHHLNREHLRPVFLFSFHTKRHPVSWSKCIKCLFVVEPWLWSLLIKTHSCCCHSVPSNNRAFAYL